LKIENYATVVLVMHNLILVQREREREIGCVWYKNAETGDFI
jgi:hypothetical protein